jgi:hypothetical protein
LLYIKGVIYLAISTYLAPIKNDIGGELGQPEPAYLELAQSVRNHLWWLLTGTVRFWWTELRRAGIS